MTKSLSYARLHFAVVDRELRFVCDHERITPNWREWIVSGLRALTYDIEVDDGLVRVFRQSHQIARLAFRSVEEIASEYGDEDWFHARSPCPLVGSVLGYVEFEPADVPSEHQSQHWPGRLAGLLGDRTAGPAVDHFCSEDVLQPLVERKFPLAHCLYAQGGFNQGLISTEEPYMTMIETEINDRMRRLGIGSRVHAGCGYLVPDYDKYTPFVFNFAWHPKDSPIVDLQGKRIRRPEDLLANEVIGLWTYNDDFEDKVRFIG